MTRADIKKLEGVVLGAALGDAFGWPHEDRARRSSKPHNGDALFESWTKRSGGRFQPHEEKISAGSYSDDTQLLIAVARSRLREDSWWKYLAFIEFPFWTIYQRGGGGASLRAAKLLEKGHLPWESATTDRQKYFEAGGNGVAMRIAPHCILGCLDSDFSGTATNVMADGVLTHGHPTALVGALGYAYGLWTALRKRGTLEYGQLIEEVRTSSDCWSNIPSISEQWPTWESETVTEEYRKAWQKSVRDIHDRLQTASEGLGTGALDFDDEVLKSIGCFDKKISGAGTVSAAAAIFLSSKYAVSPMEGVARAALAKGADTDTIASMTGAIAGAINGIQWLLGAASLLQDERFLVALAQRMQNRLEGRAVSNPSPNSNFRSLLSALSRGETVIQLPTGSKAKVVGDGGVVSRSDKLFAASWKLEDEDGQTYFVKQLKSQAKSQVATSQENLDLSSVEGIRGKFAGISLFAKDLEESRRFYSHFLGLPIKRDTGVLVALGDHLVLRQNNQVRSVGEGSIVYVDVSDINKCWKSLSVLKYAQASLIEKRSSSSSFTCKDPDGRTVEVFQR